MEEPEDTPLSIAAAWMLGLGFLVFLGGVICLVVGVGLTAGAPEVCKDQTLANATGPCKVPVLWLRIGIWGAGAGAVSALLGLGYFGVRKLGNKLRKPKA